MNEVKVEEVRVIKNSITDNVDPKPSSFKSYLFNDLDWISDAPSIRKVDVLKEGEIFIVKAIDKDTKEEECFLYHYVGNEAIIKCFTSAIEDFLNDSSEQSVVILQDLLINESQELEEILETLFKVKFEEHNINNVSVSTSEVSNDTYIDFVSGDEVMLNEARFNYFNTKSVNIREILKLFRSHINVGWQAFIIRIKIKDDLMFNIILLNPTKNNSDPDINIPVNSSLTVALNFHFEKQLNCSFTQFINSLTEVTYISLITKFTAFTSEFMCLKSLLFHTCYKYINVNDAESASDENEYIKRLKDRIKKIEKETRVKISSQLSNFYFEQYSNLKTNYVQACSNSVNPEKGIEIMKRADVQFHHSLCAQNFIEIGDSSSKVKGMVYVMYENNQQLTYSKKLSSCLWKYKERCLRHTEARNQAIDQFKSEIKKKEAVNAQLTYKVQEQNSELKTIMEKMETMKQNYSLTTTMYERNASRDRDLINSNMKEIHSLVKYINKLRFMDDDSDSQPSKKSIIRAREFYDKPPKNNTPVDVKSEVDSIGSEDPFARIRIQKDVWSPPRFPSAVKKEPSDKS